MRTTTSRFWVSSELTETQAKSPSSNQATLLFLKVTKLRSGGSLCIGNPCAPSAVTCVGAKSEQSVTACL